MKWICLLLSASSLVFVGCKSFDTAWTEASKKSVLTNSLEGCWEGTWRSDANGHEGSLRCVVTQRSDGDYNARYYAIYQKVIGFGYTIVLRSIENNGVSHFSGEANLGWWAGGVYNYEGSVQETNFFSKYRCKYDHGTFRMTRAR